MSYKVKIFDSDVEIVAELQRAFADIPAVTVQLVDSMRYLKPPGAIDVLYLPLAAAEPFGSKPVWHQSLILPTTPESQRGGMPAFVVTGTGLLPGDPRGPIPEMKMLLSFVFSAIRAFNGREKVKLESVGFWACNLLEYQGVRALSGAQVRELLSSAVPALLT